MKSKDTFFFTVEPGETAPDSVIVGAYLRCVDGAWACGEDKVPVGTKLLLLSCTACAQHWADGSVVDREWAAPGRSLGEICDALTDVCDTHNAEIPERNWERDANDNPRPPWSVSFAAYGIDEVSAEKYTFANGTVGARLAVLTLVDRVKTMRKLRGADVIPVVELANKEMKTKYGTKLRPEFKIVDWRRIGGGPAPQIEQPKPEPAKKLTKVAEPTLREELNDDMPF
jgi:hypothetical protein